MASSTSNVETEKARFNAEAANWDKNPDVVKSSESALEALLKHVPKLNQDGGAKAELDVLEIGCGTGLLSFMLSPHVRSLVGVDTADGMINAFNAKLAQQLKKQILAGEGADLNLVPACLLLENPDDARLQAAAEILLDRRGEKNTGGKSRFDLVISHLTLHHIPSMPGIMKTAYACLKPGGYVAFTDFEDFGEDAVMFHPKSKREGVERHGIKRKEIEQDMKAAGFQDVKVDATFKLTKKVEERDEAMDFPFLTMIAKKAS